MSEFEVERQLLRRLIADVEQARERLRHSVRWHSPAERAFESRRSALEQQLAALDDHLGSALRSLVSVPEGP